MIFDHLFGLNKVHYYGLSENVEFCFFSSVSIANSAPLTSISSVDNWKRDDPNQFFKDPLYVNYLWPAHHYTAVAKCWKPWLILSGAHKAIKEIGHREGRGGWKKPLIEKKYFCTYVHLFIKYHLKWEDSEFKLLRTKF